jgi:AraC-like DNA-binding protein
VVSVTDSEAVRIEPGDRNGWRADGVEVFLDVFHRQSPLTDSSYVHMVAGRGGACYASRGYPIWARTNDIAAAVEMTESDSGYTARFAVAWDVLGRVPAPSMTMGLDIVNTDRDRRDGLQSFATLGGLKPGNHHNCSEFGVLLLAGSRAGGAWWLVAGAVLVGLTAALMFRHRSSLSAATKDRSGGEEGIVVDITRVGALAARMLDIANGEYSDPELCLGTLGERLGRSPKYLSALFKKECGLGFSEYLNRVRVQKADSMLKETTRTISQIGLAVGYSSYEYFSKQYKRVHGVPPSKAREGGVTP